MNSISKTANNSSILAKCQGLCVKGARLDLPMAKPRRGGRWWYPFSWGWGSGGLEGEEGDDLVRVLEHVEPDAIMIDFELVVIGVDELTVAAHLEGQGLARRVVPVDLVQHVVLGKPSDRHVLLAGVVRRFIVVAAAELEGQQGQKTAAQKAATVGIESRLH